MHCGESKSLRDDTSCALRIGDAALATKKESMMLRIGDAALATKNESLKEQVNGRGLGWCVSCFCVSENVRHV